MQKAEKKLIAILKRADGTSASFNKLANLKVVDILYSNYFLNYRYKSLKFIPKIFAISFILYIWFVISSSYKFQCLLEMPIDSTKIFRKPENCMMCTGVTKIQRVKNISHKEFDEYYARTGIPVVVSDGAIDWSALNTFNFDFFKQLYNRVDDERDTVDDCQFFPYKTEFKSLANVFNMSEGRARLEPGTESWYIGWSNCNNNAGKILRQYYTKPYFLPKNSENIALSWIFMGGPGDGAHMHVDNVIYPSWQAQISGKKRWRLMPPPECLYQCIALSVVVYSGEIIVVDTNRWYHQTHILDGDISITIGTEFD